MSKKPFLIFSLIAVLIVGGLWLYCMPSLGKDTPKPTSTPSSTLTKGTTLEEALVAAIDEVMAQNPGFNDNARYLGIDTSMLTSLEEEGKAALLTALEKYNLTILDAPFEKLQQEGYIKDLIFTEGLFLQIEEEVVSENEIILYPSKWRSTTLHIGCSQMVLTQSDSGWHLSAIGNWWHM